MTRRITNKLDKIRRLYIQFRLAFISNPRKRADWLRKKKIFHYIGANVNIKTRLLPAEPFLVALHDNVYLAADVRLITHSLTNMVFNNLTHTRDFYAPYGKIEIKNNVFVGAGAIIMYGVTIGANVIVAAGSIVTKDVPDGSVVAGIPAKVIGSFEETMKREKIRCENFKRKPKGRTVRDLLEVSPVEFEIDKQ